MKNWKQVLFDIVKSPKPKTDHSKKERKYFCLHDYSGEYFSPKEYKEIFDNLLKNHNGLK